MNPHVPQPHDNMNPGKPSTPIEEYFRWEEMATAINDVRFQEFGSDKDLLELYLLRLCEIKAMELNVVLDFEG